MLPAYVVHVMEGRAHLRHHVFLDKSSLAAAQSLLAAESDVREVTPGHASLLLFLQPGADLAALCGKLEKSLPELMQISPTAFRRQLPQLLKGGLRADWNCASWRTRPCCASRPACLI